MFPDPESAGHGSWMQQWVNGGAYPKAATCASAAAPSDSLAQKALNERLSRERARAVRAYLVANHALPSYRIVAVGRGAADPLAPNTTAEGRALNRRIDVLLDTRRVVTVAAASAGAARSLE